MKQLFKLRGELSKKTETLIGLSGLIIILLAWYIITSNGMVPKSILPNPIEVLKSFKTLHFDKFLVKNTLYSLRLNYLGYIEAVLIAVPLGFAIGLMPFFRALFSKYVDSVRFVPLTALVGLFIAWFGIYDNMKVQFLTFGIFVYLLPIVVQRINEVDKIYVQAAQTLGGSNWQIIKHIFVPSVLSKLFDDIKVIVAISWTYIIIAEMVNSTGGIGAMIFKSARQSRTEEVFALLIVIILIGIIQDRLFTWADKILFPYKHLKKA
jgi:NitT/TauT family transport system permease protein